MVKGWQLLVVLSFGCGRAQDPLIVAHRAQGVGPPGENMVANAAAALQAGFGVELDIRGDGELRFELGHLSPSGQTLGDALTAVEAGWDPDMAGQLLVLDIANDRGDQVSGELLEYLRFRLEGSPLRALHFIVQSSTVESLARLFASLDPEVTPLTVSFAMTYWSSPEYTLPDWVDLLSTSVREMGGYPYPRPLLLFGVEERAAYRAAVNAPGEVFALITDHPRRLANLAD